MASSSIAAAGVAGGWWLWRKIEESTIKPPGVVFPASEPLGLTPKGKLLDTDFSDPFAGRQLLGYLPFMLEDNGMYRNSKIVARGHNARRCIDLASLLTPQGRSTPASLFYIRTEYPDLLKPPAEWTIKIHGKVKQPQDLPLKALLPKVHSRGSVLLECSGNARQLKFGLLSVAEWSGIPFETVKSLAQPTSKAKAVLVSGFDGDSNLPYHPPPYKTHSWPTCSWIFTLDQLADAGAFLATEMNGKPLQKDNGAPVRLVVPGWYGCSEVKWVNEIKFVDNDQPATLQMREFAGRTFQETQPAEDGTRHPVGPERARDYRPGTIDQTVVPVRVEQWNLGEKLGYRVVGITWGGQKRSDKLLIRFNALLGRSKSLRPGKFAPVQLCAAKTSNREYGIWCHQWMPPHPGAYWIDLRLQDQSIPTRKMSQPDRVRELRGLLVGCCNRLVIVPAV